jgi:hypothetical protein
VEELQDTLDREIPSFIESFVSLDAFQSLSKDFDNILGVRQVQLLLQIARYAVGQDFRHGIRPGGTALNSVPGWVRYKSSRFFMQ